MQEEFHGLVIGWRESAGWTRPSSALRALGSTPLTEAQGGAKLAGCQYLTVDALLKALHHGQKLSKQVRGHFLAMDGVQSDEISMPDLGRGMIVHSDAAGADLPEDLGGPVRVVYPPGCAVQSAICGTPKPVNLKKAVRLMLNPGGGTGLACDDDASDSD